MKKYISLFSIMLFLFMVITPISTLAWDEYCTVIFRTDDEFIHFTGNSTSISLDVKVGSSIRTPIIYSSLYGCDYAFRLVSTGETVDPTTLTATGDSMYFDVYFPDRPEVIHSITYICHDYPGIMMPGDNRSNRGEITVWASDGYIIQKSDLPVFPPIDGGNLSNLYLVWTPDPIGYEVHEDVTFTATVEDTGFYSVTFWGYAHEELAYYSHIPRGTAVAPPEEVPDYNGRMFTGKWSNDDYLNVQRHVNVFAEYILRGDANGNDKLDVGDATLILRSIVHLEGSQAHYDYNADGRINSGDAAAVLRAVVGK